MRGRKAPGLGGGDPRDSLARGGGVGTAPPQKERCRSGRTGRSRKPLTAQAVRGFESHPLRQTGSRGIRSGSRGTTKRRPPATAGERGPATERKEGDGREEDVSTQQPPAQAHPRLPRADAHAPGARGPGAAPPQGAQAPGRLSSPTHPSDPSDPGEPSAPSERSGEPTGGGRPRGECLPKAERLRRRQDYLRCYREGRRLHGELAILHAAANREGHPRLGVTASRKVGGSAVRQRLRRRVREVYRRWEGRGRLPAADLVVHLKPAAAAAGFGELREELERLLGLALRPPRAPSAHRRRPPAGSLERPRA